MLASMRKRKATPKIQQRLLLDSTTLRGFSGGLDTTDDDLNLTFKYATKLVNIKHGIDGAATLRWGNELFATLPAPIIDMIDFSSSIVAVLNDGRVFRVQRNGTFAPIWNTAIAAALPGAPAAWSATTYVTFTKFNGKLIIVNGIDKPIEVDKVFFVEYLQDAATNSNLNVPVAKYVATTNRYVVMAGDALHPTRVHISARDAEGTWSGDPPPNDATYIDVGSALPPGSVIRGLLPFRGTLLVLFAEGIVVGKLGIYDDTGNHTPNFDDAIELYGGVSQRTAVTYGDDGILLDLLGIPSVKRNVFNGSVTPDRQSELIATDVISAVSALSNDALDERTFTVYNQREQEFMLFVPNASTIGATTANKVFVFNHFTKTNKQNWSFYDFGALVFTCGCRILEGDVLFGDASGKIWRYGSKDYPLYADNGQPIAFDWELPWLDFKARANVKNSKYISFDVRGNAEFTCRMYVDQFVEQPMLDDDDNVYYVDTPQLVTGFSGGEQEGFGNGPQPYGGGRNARFIRKFGWPAKFLIAKLRFSGSTTEKLSFVSITIHFQKGSINR